ncbi:MAG: GTPase Era, partial [Butyricicoccus sp.]|nr:GTPase Era [Butyricicoccus sp.]
MEITKSVVVSVVGRPNVGKSTLTNKLVGRKIAIVSNKPQTTRTRITGILNQDGCQYVFLDTPGLHKPRSRLGDYMVKVVTDTVAEVDVAMVVVEPIPNVGGPEETLIKQLRDSGIPGILVINKTDTVKKEELLAVIAAYAEKFDWSAVIPASAKHSDNLDIILKELDKFSLEGPQLFPD